MKRILLTLILLLASSGAAALEVVATTSSMGAVARAVGGDTVNVEVLTPPDRDAHALEARPTMVRALRDAHLLVAEGADLEVGWLPAALRRAGNADIQSGADGYFEAAAQVELIGQESADRSEGHVHPAGNPHVHMDPVRMQRIAGALADRMARLDPANSDAYWERASAFRDAVDERLDDWRERLADHPGAILYHKDGNYLLERFEVPVRGYAEPKPGIPPTARHIRDLVRKFEGEDGVVIHTRFQDGSAPGTLGDRLDWPVAEVPLEPPVDAATEGYLDLVEAWVAALERAR
ncbi:metal ABC transporter substrate-binding protein [Thiohalospira sp.]|uniref:metal ABC transporter substrate-binding protein n=1 Tax=Thiohalospira sp. TaxID=3080549 RepID=UPI0039815D89